MQAEHIIELHPALRNPRLINYLWIAHFVYAKTPGARSRLRKVLGDKLTMEKRRKMQTPGKSEKKLPKQLSALPLILFVMFSVFVQQAFAQQSARFSFDGLVAVENTLGTIAYIDPEADFSVYTRVMILEPHVAFRSNWQRDQNRRRGRNINARDVARIKADTASFFRQIFTQNLEMNDGYEVVDEVGYDVLILRPAIIDLDITSPDVAASGRSRTYTASAGSATLFIELFDSVSGQIIGRATDRQVARSAGGSVTWNNRIMNRAEGRRIFNDWAQQLRSFLDQHYTKK